MTTTRQQKVSRLLQRELGDYFQKRGPEMTGGKMVTVTIVRITPDLGLARVYLSLFPGEGHEASIEAVNHAGPSIRSEMGRRMRHQLKHIPAFEFFLDDSLDYIDKIDNLLKD